MPQRQHSKPNPAAKHRDDFLAIDGIGPALARRLWDAGVLAYNDLARRSPEEIATILTGVAGISAERIASQNWTGQARALATPPRDASVPRQHYAAFHVEFLLESDNSVRRTKIRNHQTDARGAWSGWDEQQLLSFIRNHIPLPAAAASAADAPSSATVERQTPDQPPKSVRPTPPGRPSPRAMEPLPFGSLAIEEVASIRDDQRIYVRRPDEPNSIRLTMRMKPVGMVEHDKFDFCATIAARNFGGSDRSPLGTAMGDIRIGDPVSVEVAGPALPVGLYRLAANVEIYRPGHSAEEPPLYSEGASGDLMRVS